MLFNKRGEVSEGSVCNIAVEIDGKERLATPAIRAGLLEGVKRNELVKSGELEERLITRSDLISAQRKGLRVVGVSSSREIFDVEILGD